MKIAACVILYNPDKNVIQNIQSYINHVTKFYLIDNSENINIDIQENYSSLSKTLFIHDGINKGIATRLNQACDLAIKDGFDYLLTMDQDSFFENESFTQYLKYISNYDEITKVSMFGINHESKSNAVSCNYEKVKMLITSGSIINLHNYKNIGAFDENLFIDLVDTEFCFRSILKQYQLVKFPGIYLHHAIGEITQQRSVKNLQVSKRSIHSGLRLYYMVRNFFYVDRKYKDHFAHELSVIKTDLLHRIKNKLLYNNKRLQTIQFIIKARKDFKQGKMGKRF